jgi:hypothetical protein
VCVCVCVYVCLCMYGNRMENNVAAVRYSFLCSVFLAKINWAINFEFGTEGGVKQA